MQLATTRVSRFLREKGEVAVCTDTKKQTLSVQLCVTIRDAILACAQKPTLTHNNSHHPTRLDRLVGSGGVNWALAAVQSTVWGR